MTIQSFLNARNYRFGFESLTSVFEIGTLIMALILTAVENEKTHLPSNVLLVYWLLLAIISGIKFRTLAMGCPVSIIHPAKPEQYPPVALILTGAKFIDAILIFGLECVPREAGIRLGDDEAPEKSPEEEANIFSIVSFHWVTGLMRKGYASPLAMDDLWALGKEDRSRNISDTFDTIWERELQKDCPSLLRALSCAFGRPFYVAGIWKAASDVLAFVQPVLLRELLRFFMSYKTKDPQPLYRGYSIAIWMFVCAVAQTIFLNQYYHLCFRCGMHVRTSLVTAIYKKSLRLSNPTRQTFMAGEVANHMSIDTQRLQNLVSYLHTSWSGLFQIGIALYLLYDAMGWAICAGVFVMLLAVPLHTQLSAMMNILQQKQLENKDVRIRLLNELLNGIRIIKLYAWENAFMQRILTIRNDDELTTLKKLGYLSAVESITWSCTPFFVSLATFAVYVLVLKKPMTADIVFPSIVLFNLLQLPLALFPDVISSSMEAYASLCRIKTFLMSPEVDPDTVIIEEPRPPSNEEDTPDNHVLVVTDATYSWYKDSEPVISDINLTLKSDDLLCVVGRSCSGKSSFMAALCNDMERVAGEIRVRGPVAFVPQQPWIINDTLRANILFGNPFDQTYYQQTVEACCLQPDFEKLLNGDMTEIGERGINLSDSQKTRISFARAVYARADIYLFDDPLPEADPRVGRDLFEKVIGPRGLLKEKARILVTNQIQFLVQSTVVMMLKDGQVAEKGDYQELMTKKGEVFELMSEIGRDADHQPGFTEKEEIEPIVEQNTILEEDVVETDAFPAEEAPLLSCTPRSARRNSIRSVTSVRALCRPSAASFLHGNAEKSAVSKTPTTATFVETEERVRDSAYKVYAKACSYSLVILYMLLMLLSQMAFVLTYLWLARWSSRSPDDDTNSSQYYIGIYAVLGLSSALLTIFQSTILLVHCGIRSARVLHQDMLQSILRSPMMFFDATPVSRILNRFSKDQSTVDEVLPRSFSSYSYTVFQVASALVVLTLATPIIIAVIIPIAIVYFWLRRYYLATSREVRRLDSATRSPVMNHLQETLGGITTIRAYRQQTRFIQENEHRLDQNLRAYYPTIAGNRWLAFRLETLSSIVIFGAASLSVFSLARGNSVDPGLIGLSLTYALSIAHTLNWMVRQYTEIESNIASVEHLQEYIELPQEAPEVIGFHRPPEDWPDKGQVEFEDNVTRYRARDGLVSRGIGFTIQSHEKVGICGRPDTDKPSFPMSLFRISEAAGEQITVDGKDISTYGLSDLRSRLSIFLQDPVIFADTIRFNLDPLNTKSDLEIWEALEDVGLKPLVSGLGGELQAMMLEGGENFTVGQRQLLCLARALLRKKALLIFDDTTAAIDPETDMRIREIIREKCKDCTVLTITHKINTVKDCDKVMVFEQGRVVEFGEPAKLLKDKRSSFYSLAKESDVSNA
ncbi:MAG: multi drug resistance-associated protein MRP [Benniella sp.]|nr:MAG: multi drug resistance-associated protein MRP [Benniella sp.]